jgi:hypothetical protein
MYRCYPQLAHTFSSGRDPLGTVVLCARTFPLRTACILGKRRVSCRVHKAGGVWVRTARFIAVAILCILHFIISLALTAEKVHGQPTETASLRVKVVAVNILLGAVTAGGAQGLRGRNPLGPAIRGALGGGLVLAGKCVVGLNRNTTDWIGRGTVSVGSSIVANASAGEPLFGKLSFALGPIRLHREVDSKVPRAKLNLATFGVAVYFLTQGKRTFQPIPTLQHGVPIFQGERGQANEEAAGVLVLVPGVRRAGITHELAHVTQGEFISLAWGAPFEDWLMGKHSALRVMHQYVDLGLIYPVWAALNGLVEHDKRPWEREANSIMDGC